MKKKSLSVIVPVRFPDELYDRLCILKEREHNKPVSVIIREAVADYLNKKGVKPHGTK